VNSNDKILITGGNGLIGTALTRHLSALGFSNLIIADINNCNLKDMEATLAFFKQQQPDYVFHLAATVYGVMGNIKNKGMVFLDNILINTNVVECCRQVNVKKIVAMGTSAAYPEPAHSLPLKEKEFWLGEPHYSESSYAHAKRAMLAHLLAYRESFAMPFAYVIGTNLYGPNDKFDIENGHVIPSLIRKFYDAKQNNDFVTVWGNGTACRDFLYSEDAACALHIIMDKVDGPVNLATGKVHSIQEVTSYLAKYLNMEGMVKWDTTKPNGLAYREFDVSILTAAGFKPKIDLEAGLINTYEWYCRNVSTARK